MQRQSKKNNARAVVRPNKSKSSARTVENKFVLETANANYTVERQLSSNEEAVVPHTAATLFADILRTKPAINFVKENADDDSGSDEQLGSIVFEGETSGKSVPRKIKMNFNDIFSANSSSSLCAHSHSRTETNIDVLEKLKNIENKIDDLGRRHEKSVLLLAQANAKIDSFMAVSSNKKQTEDETGKSFEITLIAVKSLAELEAYEERCKDNCYVEKVIRSMEQIHGKNRFKGKGGTVCLQLIDYFVDRNFFRHCSWTGISKTLDEDRQLVKKIQFSKYEGYINLFYKVVRNADEEFTMDECNKLFKQCLRNSKQRLDDIKMLRTPVARKRSRAELKSLPNQSAFEIEYLEDIINQEQEAPEQKENMCEVIFEEGLLAE